jgi:TetR/AcrR family transcriptional repressor of nem operon
MSRGRPREFDETEALEAAMRAFWRRGYAATSVDDLMEATGLARQSLYRTFGGKRALFLRAVDYYGQNVTGRVIDIINSAESPLAGVRGALKVQERMSRETAPAGCLLSNSFGQFLQEDEDVREVLLRNFERLVRALQSAIRRAQDQGEINSAVDARAVGRTLACTINGLTGFNRMGFSTAYVRDIVHTLEQLLSPLVPPEA